MFLGTYEPNLMEKGRVALPKKIREQLGGEEMVLTIGFETCILGFTNKQWEEVTRPEMNRSLFSDKEGRDLRRKIYADAINVRLDSQGRCIVPQHMLEYAHINDGVVIIGAGDHFEIWEKTRWEKYRSGLTQNAR